MTSPHLRVASDVGGTFTDNLAYDERAKRVTIAFDDPTVPCFAPVWETAIAQVLGELRAAGVADKCVHLICGIDFPARDERFGLFLSDFAVEE